jgi:hypothetical protein
MDTHKERMQYVFDTSVNGVLTQGKKSSVFGECVYRSESGCKCAVGHLIKDDEYDSTIEGKNVRHDDDVQDAISNSIGFDIDNYAFIDLLSSLQDAHDTAKKHDFSNDFEFNAINVAIEYGLEWKFDYDGVAQ